MRDVPCTYVHKGMIFMSREKFNLLLKVLLIVIIIIFIVSIIKGNRRLISKCVVLIATYVVAIKRLSKK